MKKITFRYRDHITKARNPEHWNTQQCVTTSVQKCIEFYGLNEPDVDYEIISVEDVN